MDKAYVMAGDGKAMKMIIQMDDMAARYPQCLIDGEGVLDLPRYDREDSFVLPYYLHVPDCASHGTRL